MAKPVTYCFCRSKLELVMWLILCLSIEILAWELSSKDNPNYKLNKNYNDGWLRGHRRDAREIPERFGSKSKEKVLNSDFNNGCSLARDKRTAPIVFGENSKNYTKSDKPLTDKPDSAKSFSNKFPLAKLLEKYINKTIDLSRYFKNGTKMPFDTKNETSEVIQVVKKKEPKYPINEYGSLTNLKTASSNSSIAEEKTTVAKSVNYNNTAADENELLEAMDNSKEVKKQRVNENEIQTVNTSLYKIPVKESKADMENTHSSELIKVLSLLRRSSKQIMDLEISIKSVHDIVDNSDKRIIEKIYAILKKLNDFDVKYMTILKAVDTLENIQERLNKKEKTYKFLEKLMSQNLQEFESQQKKFLAQQEQFYNIQKMILSHNEKVNSKQKAITKTQNRISRIYSKFTKALQKNNQALNNNKHFRLDLKAVRIKKGPEGLSITKKEFTGATSTAPVARNLYLITQNIVVENKNRAITKVKDQSVDDINHKYYNKTFINDHNKTLEQLLIGNKTNVTKNEPIDEQTQQKTTNSVTLQTSTIMLPGNNGAELDILKREPRTPDFKKIYRRKHKKNKNAHHKDENSTTVIETRKIIDKAEITNRQNMATNFCKKIGQGQEQTLDSCIEKTIRRLQYLDRPVPIVTSMAPETTTITTTTPEPISTTNALDLPDQMLSPWFIYPQQLFTVDRKQPSDRTTTEFPDMLENVSFSLGQAKNENEDKPANETEHQPSGPTQKSETGTIPAIRKATSTPMSNKIKKSLKTSILIKALQLIRSSLDSYQAYANYLAYKFRNYSPKTLVSVEHEINDVLRRADNGKLEGGKKYRTTSIYSPIEPVFLLPPRYTSTTPTTIRSMQIGARAPQSNKGSPEQFSTIEVYDLKSEDSMF